MAAPKKNRPYIKILYVRADGYRAETTLKGPTVTDKMIKAVHKAELAVLKELGAAAIKTKAKGF